MTTPMAEEGLFLISQSHARQMALCDDLEAIADGLPDNVNRQLCLHLARAVCPTVAASHEVEERVLFPAVQALSPTIPDIVATIERLRWEHFEDMCFAEELHDALLSIGCGEQKIAADAAGYMLRGFFESVRRHVAFEREMLAPLMQLALQRAAGSDRGLSRNVSLARRGRVFRRGGCL